MEQSSPTSEAELNAESEAGTQEVATASLFEVLTSRNKILEENELWALCRECCLTLEYVQDCHDMFQTLCINPDSVAFDADGNVCFLDLDIEPEARYLAPEDAQCEPKSYKSHLFSLGMTLQFATECKIRSSHSRVQLSERFVDLVATLTCEEVEGRPELEMVIEACEQALAGASSQEICTKIVGAPEDESPQNEAYEGDSMCPDVSDDLSAYLETKSGLVQSPASDPVWSTIADSGAYYSQAEDNFIGRLPESSTNNLLDNNEVPRLDQTLRTQNRDTGPLVVQDKWVAEGEHALKDTRIDVASGQVAQMKAIQLGNLLSSLDRCLEESELWSICRECVLCLQREIKSFPAYISLDTITIMDSGAACFEAIPDDKLLEVMYMAPELRKDGVLSHKTSLYGLGIALRNAASFKCSSSESAPGEEALDILIAAFTYDNPDKRPDLETAYEMCEEYEKVSRTNSHQVCLQLYDEAMSMHTSLKNADSKKVTQASFDLSVPGNTEMADKNNIPVSSDRICSSASTLSVGSQLHSKSLTQNGPEETNPEPLSAFRNVASKPKLIKDMKRPPSAYSSPATHFKPIVLQSVATESTVLQHTFPSENVAKVSQAGANGMTQNASEQATVEPDKEVTDSGSSNKESADINSTSDRQNTSDRNHTSDRQSLINPDDLGHTIQQLQSQGHLPSAEVLASALAQYFTDCLTGATFNQSFPAASDHKKHVNSTSAVRDDTSAINNSTQTITAVPPLTVQAKSPPRMNNSNQGTIPSNVSATHQTQIASSPSTASEGIPTLQIPQLRSENVSKTQQNAPRDNISGTGAQENQPFPRETEIRSPKVPGPSSPPISTSDNHIKPYSFPFSELSPPPIPVQYTLAQNPATGLMQMVPLPYVPIQQTQITQGIPTVQTFHPNMDINILPNKLYKGDHGDIKWPHRTSQEHELSNRFQRNLPSWHQPYSNQNRAPRDNQANLTDNLANGYQQMPDFQTRPAIIQNNGNRNNFQSSNRPLKDSGISLSQQCENSPYGTGVCADGQPSSANSDSYRTFSILVDVIREAIGEDEIAASGSSDLAIAEYVMSLSSLTWDTFCKAVREKYFNFDWSYVVLDRLFSASDRHGELQSNYTTDSPQTKFGRSHHKPHVTEYMESSHLLPDGEGLNRQINYHSSNPQKLRSDWQNSYNRQQEKIESRIMSNQHQQSSQNGQLFFNERYNEIHTEQQLFNQNMFHNEKRQHSLNQGKRDTQERYQMFNVRGIGRPDRRNISSQGEHDNQALFQIFSEHGYDNQQRHMFCNHHKLNYPETSQTVSNHDYDNYEQQNVPKQHTLDNQRRQRLFNQSRLDEDVRQYFSNQQRLDQQGIAQLSNTLDRNSEERQQLFNRLDNQGRYQVHDRLEYDSHERQLLPSNKHQLESQEISRRSSMSYRDSQGGHQLSNQHIIDSHERQRLSDQHVLDSHEGQKLSKQHKFNNDERQHFSDLHKLNSHGRQQFSNQHKPDSLERQQFSNQLKPDSLERQQFSNQQTPDSIERQQFSNQHKPDSLERQQFSNQLKPDSIERQQFSNQQTPDSIERQQFPNQHKPDNLERQQFSNQHKPDSLERQQFSNQHQPDKIERQSNQNSPSQISPAQTATADVSGMSSLIKPRKSSSHSNRPRSEIITQTYSQNNISRLPEPEIKSKKWPSKKGFELDNNKRSLSLHNLTFSGSSSNAIGGHFMKTNPENRANSAGEMSHKNKNSLSKNRTLLNNSATQNKPGYSQTNQDYTSEYSAMSSGSPQTDTTSAKSSLRNCHQRPTTNPISAHSLFKFPDRNDVYISPPTSITSHSSYSTSSGSQRPKQHSLFTYASPSDTETSAARQPQLVVHETANPIRVSLNLPSLPTPYNHPFHNHQSNVPASNYNNDCNNSKPPLVLQHHKPGNTQKPHSVHGHNSANLDINHATSGIELVGSEENLSSKRFNAELQRPMVGNESRHQHGQRHDPAVPSTPNVVPRLDEVGSLDSDTNVSAMRKLAAEKPELYNDRISSAVFFSQDAGKQLRPLTKTDDFQISQMKQSDSIDYKSKPHYNIQTENSIQDISITRKTEEVGRLSSTLPRTGFESISKPGLTGLGHDPSLPGSTPGGFGDSRSGPNNGRSFSAVYSRQPNQQQTGVVVLDSAAEATSLPDARHRKSSEGSSQAPEVNSVLLPYVKKGGVVYHSAKIQLSLTPEVDAFIHSIDEENKQAIEKLLANVSQEVTVQRRQRQKTQKLYKKLTEQNAADKKGDQSVTEQTLKDMSDMTKKLSFLHLCQTHLQMLLAELYGLDSNLLFSLSITEGSAPLNLQPAPRNPYLQFRSISTPGAEQMAVLQAGTPRGLMSYLYTSSALSEGYIHQFLFCYRYILTAEQLLIFILEKFHSAQRNNQNDVNMNCIQRRSIDLLQFWVEGYYSIDFSQNKGLLKKLSEFLIEQTNANTEGADNLYSLYAACRLGENSELMRMTDVDDDSIDEGTYFFYLDNPKRWDSFRSLLKRSKSDKSKSTRGGSLKSKSSYKTPSAGSEKPSVQFSVAECSAHVLAEQLTLIEQEQFKKCHPVHFLNSQFQGVGVALSMPGLRTPSMSRKLEASQSPKRGLFVGEPTVDSYVVHMINHAQELAHWVSAEILSCGSNKTQISVITKFLTTAHLCHHVRNYATAFSILDGLENIVVRQLPVWKNVSDKVLAYLDELSNVKMKLKSEAMWMMSEKDCHIYPTIPCALFIALHIQQVEIGSFTLASGMYKWDKMRSISEVVDQLRIFRSHEYAFQNDFDIQRTIHRCLSEYSEQDLHAVASTQNNNFRRHHSSSSLSGTLKKVKNILMKKR